MKKWLAIGLFIVLLLPMTIGFAEDTPQFLTAQELLARDEVLSSIRIGEDEIPTIFSVVGRREITEAGFSVVSSNGLEERYVYRSDTVYGDLRAYAARLLENGWEELKAPADAESWDMVYAKPSAYDDQMLTVVVNYGTDGYVFIATKKDGAAWVADGWTPHAERLTIPEGLGAARPLGEVVRAAYEKAGLLSMRDGRMAYVPFFYRENCVCVSGISHTWDWDYETLEAYGSLVHDAIITKDGVVCLTDDDYDDSNTMLEYLDLDGNAKTVLPEWPEEDGARPVRQFGGPLLQLPDGTLLFRDKFGAIYVCGADGSSLRAIPGIRADGFVYYDDFVYFANLDDTITHKNVYDGNASEYVDFSYPCLYRAALDGSGLEKLTVCGVRGLASQGSYIIYQNLGEPFTLPVFEQTGPEILCGPLYCHNADTGEQSALNIKSDTYVPTPYGLAVWYHDFAFEPYDITAELVLHGFDGTPMYRLDAGGAQFIGDACVYGETLCFYAYNWAINWDEDEYEEEIFTVVPLDGGQSGDIALLLDYILIGDMEIPLDAETVDLSGSELYYPEPEELEPLQRLPNLRVLTANECGIDDVSKIGKLTTLETLELFDNIIEDLTPLAGLSNLRTLDVSWNYINDIAPLAGLSNLHTLDIGLNQIGDLSPLAGLTNLCTLNISENPVEDLSPLYALTNLEELYLYDMGEGLTREAVKALAERLPHTGIFCDFFTIPRLIDEEVLELGPAVPVAGDGILTETILGAEILHGQNNTGTYHR